MAPALVLPWSGPFGTTPATRRSASAARQHHHPVPAVYRHLFSTVEPLLALNGAFTASMRPVPFLLAMNPHASPTDYHAPSRSQLSERQLAAPPIHVVFDQLAATYVFFGLTLALVLRATRDLAAWRAVILAALVCDALHIAAGWRSLGDGRGCDAADGPASGGGGGGNHGGSGGFCLADPLGTWRAEEWVNFGILAAVAVARCAFLLGLGVRRVEGGTARGKTE